MVQTPKKQEKATPEQQYQEMRMRVAGFKDDLGTTVDENIFETVVMLNLVGITTFQSCEGHLDHGRPYPWITVIDREQERMLDLRWLAICDLEELAKKAGTQEAYDRYLSADVQLRLVAAHLEQEGAFYRRLTSLLDEFYEYAVTPGPARLLVRRMKTLSRYRIEPGFSLALETIPEALRANYLVRGQTEIQAFTAFLKQRFFTQK